MRKVPPLLPFGRKNSYIPLDNQGKNRYHHRARSFPCGVMDTKEEQRHTPLPPE